jgi:ribosomal protein S18 acetylase RimI-like enzyme
MMENLRITQANENHLQELVPLFDAYRQFYLEPPDPEGARLFLSERLDRNESVILLGTQDGHPLGFVQLYPSFTSTKMRRLWILNDLFVSPAARMRGVGQALLREARQYASKTDAEGLTLETWRTNVKAQRLYEKMGWKRDDMFYTYSIQTQTALAPSL